jgi:hypothetical protein
VPSLFALAGGSRLISKMLRIAGQIVQTKIYK